MYRSRDLNQSVGIPTGYSYKGLYSLRFVIDEIGNAKSVVGCSVPGEWMGFNVIKRKVTSIPWIKKLSLGH